MSQLDETEYSRLAGQVLEMEKLINYDPKNAAGVLLRNFLSNAKTRMEEILHEEGKFADSKKEQKDKEAATAVLLAERELRLSVAEKEQYAGFMELQYFTKTDFDELEEFYSTGWDKLSEDGKDRMSVRVWGGIHRKEYTFDELPQKVREKEAERMYLQLTGAIAPSPSLQSVAPESRAAFIREFEAGNEKATSKILGGEGSAAYSPDTRTEVPSEGTSASKETKSDQLMGGRDSQVETGPDSEMDGITFSEAGSVRPTNLAVSGAKSSEKTSCGSASVSPNLR